MTATDELRRMLDERGVHWWAGDDERKTLWESNGLTWEYFNDENGDAWLGFLGACEQDITPEQAIAATLDGGECVMNCVKMFPEHKDCIFECWECSACKRTNEEYRPRFCPYCGRKVKRWS